LAASGPIGTGESPVSAGSAWASRAAPAAIALGMVTFGICAATVPLDSLTHQAGTGGPLTDTLTNVVVVLPAIAVGTLLAARRPRNLIGWLILAILIVGFGPTSQYLVLDYGLHHGTLPAQRTGGRAPGALADAPVGYRPP
jgi:hypothetical protein